MTIIYGFEEFTSYSRELDQHSNGTKCLSCHRNEVHIEGSLIGDQYHWTTSGHSRKCPLASVFETLMEVLTGQEPPPVFLPCAALTEVEETLLAIHKLATPRSQDFLHPTKEFADDVAALSCAGFDALKRAIDSNTQ